MKSDPSESRARRRLPVLAFLAGYVLLAALVVAGVFLGSLRSNLAALGKTGEVRLSQAADRLQGQLESYRELPNFLARHPTVVAVLEGHENSRDANEFLLNMALTAGAQDIFLADASGRIVAASDFEKSASSLGQNIAERPDFRGAMNGGLGFFHGLDRGGAGREFFYARGVISNAAPPIGAIIVKVDLAQVEFEWRIDEDVVAFFDQDQVAFISNRPGLILRQLDQGAGALATPRTGSYPPFYPTIRRRVMGNEVWTIQGADLPRSSLVRTREIPQIDMTARAFMDIRPVLRTASLQAMLSAALAALLGLAILIVAQRRRRLTEQLAVEAAVNARLEARVEARTAELHQAQDQLIQAGKLSALGQMSAGISHELNQPLSAIQNFAENGRKLIELGRQDEARENLGLIAEQTERMNRIIRNLRAFARKEPEKLEDVEIGAIIDDAVSLTGIRSREEGVQIARTGLGGPVLVVGGRVRLQQVLVNLISNAMDAMAGQENKKITIDLARADASRVSLRVRDNGPGLADPQRAFEPFYSTKDVGASNGLGLGLSISFGIIGSFGGEIDVRNLAEGGAEFTVTLKAARQEAAA